MRRIGCLVLAVVVLSSLAPAAGAVDRATQRWLRKKPVIDSIAIEGNSQVSSERILAQMYSRERTFWRAVKGDRRSRLQRETLDRDTLEIKFLYLTGGYLGVLVEESFEVLNEDSAALVKVHIHEGRRFFYGVKTVTGDFQEALKHDLQGPAFRLKKGDPINPLEIRGAVFKMKEALANSGYPYAAISYELDTLSHDSLVPIVFDVETDSLVHFGDVDIEGVHRYPRYTARRELRVRSGDVYSREAILQSQRRLVESGYFSTFQLFQTATSTDRLNPDFVLRVRERRPHFFSFQTGAGQSAVRDLQWDVSAGFGKRNLFGSRRASVKAEYSFGLGQQSRLITNRYLARFTEPWLLGIRMPLIVTGEWEPPLKSSLQDYTIRSWSISAATTRRFGELISASVGTEYQSVKISGVPEDQIQIKKEEEDISERRKAYVLFRSDYRDDIFVPTDGTVSDLAFEYYGGSLGGDENFFRFRGSVSSFETVWPGWVSATRLKVGITEAFGGSDRVPREDRLYLGGGNTIRGFRENSLGPLRETGEADGANYLAVFNQEFRWKTAQLFRAIPLVESLLGTMPLWQSVFFDVGNGFAELRNVTLDRLACAYGTGIQIISPVGPIRLDYARRIKTTRYDLGDRWHFTILYSF